MRRVYLWVLAVAVLAAGLWSVAWLVGAREAEGAFANWLADRRAEGWQAEAAEIATGGFPLNHAIVLREVQIADPETGWAWMAPRVAFDHRVFRLGRLTVTFPPSQSLASPTEHFQIMADTMAADLRVDPARRLALWEAGFDLARVTFDSDAGAGGQIAEARLDVTRQSDRDPSAPHYALVFEATDVTPPGSLRALLDPADVLPQAMEGVRLEAMIGTDRPLDLGTIEEARPGLTAVEIAEFRADWGAVRFRAAGSVTVDDEGRPTGRLQLRAENWEQMVEMAVNAGVLPAELRSVTERTLRLLASFSGRPENLDAELELIEGLAFLGPIPLGPAPQLVLP